MAGCADFDGGAGRARWEESELAPVWESLGTLPADIERDARCQTRAVRWTLPSELNVLALVKGQERYIFVYDDDSRAELIDALRNQAASPRLSLTWFDALVLTRKAREQQQAAPQEALSSRSRV